MSSNRSVIQGSFVGRPGPRVHGVAATARPVQAHGVAGSRSAAEVIPLDPGQLNLGSSMGRPLPAGVQRKMEALFGEDFSDVRVHSGAQAHAIGAIAFTLGSNIYFAPGHYSPDTPRGHQLIGHELTHVVQQRAGRVRNPQGAGLAIVQDHALEAEADRMGTRAATATSPQGRSRP